MRLAPGERGLAGLPCIVGQAGASCWYLEAWRGRGKEGSPILQHINLVLCVRGDAVLDPAPTPIQEAYLSRRDACGRIDKQQVREELLASKAGSISK